MPDFKNVCDTLLFLDGKKASELTRQEMNAQLCIVRDGIQELIQELNDLSQRQICLEKALKGESTCV